MEKKHEDVSIPALVLLLSGKLSYPAFCCLWIKHKHRFSHYSKSKPNPEKYCYSYHGSHPGAKTDDYLRMQNRHQRGLLCRPVACFRLCSHASRSLSNDLRVIL